MSATPPFDLDAGWRLPDHPDARSALRAAGVEECGAHRKALAVLAGSHMLVRAT
jgi:mycofactocin biosynthesis protein MftB